MLNYYNNFQLSFSGSILGFETLDSFLLEAIEETPFAYLKSMEDKNISFLVTSPFEWYNDYSLQLDDSMKKKLEIEKPEDTLVISIVTFKTSLESSTINLLAPLIINVNEHKGSQYVLTGNNNYSTRSPLIVIDTEDEGGK